MKPLTSFFGAVALSTMSVFAQEQTQDQTDKAMQPAQTRLPEDQPKAAASPSAAASSPATSTTTTATGESTATAASARQPNESDVTKQMTELSKLNENHKLLSSLDGNWDFKIKFWMNPDPNAPPQEANGTATRKSIMGGRYVVMDVNSKMRMPDAAGKIKDVQFKGMGIDGYNSVKDKFVASWIDNMSTGIEYAEGTYDPATKTFTYMSDFEPLPGMKSQVRQVLKLTDKDHMNVEWYENRGGQDVKTMEIAYTRKNSGS
jgi:Protein of unknown function (DUF1579)